MEADRLANISDPEIIKYGTRLSLSDKNRLEWMIKDNHRLGLESVLGKSLTESAVDNYTVHLTDDPTAKTVVVRWDDAIIALVKVYVANDGVTSVNHISDVYVLKPFRRRGIAKTLLEFVKSRILNNGAPTTIFVQSDNPAAKSLYEAVGFKENGYSLRLD